MGDDSPYQRVLTLPGDQLLEIRHKPGGRSWPLGCERNGQRPYGWGR